MMVSKHALSAVLGSLGFLTCLLVLVCFTDPLDFSSELGQMSTLPGHSSSPSQQQTTCDQADRLLDLLSMWVDLFFDLSTCG